MAEPDFILTGERAALGVLRREHLQSLARWFTDPEVQRGLFHRGLYERASFREIGWRRDAVRALGRCWDSVLIDATAAGFESPVLARVRPDG